MRVRRAFLVSACVFVLALGASSCGGGGDTTYSGTSPEAWAAQVCGALNDWARGLQADSRVLAEQLRRSASIHSVKVKFVAFLDRAGKSADTMVARVHSAGAPAVKDGQALQRELEAGLRSARASFTRAQRKARALPDLDPQAFSSGVTSLGREVEQELTAAGQQFQELGDKYDDESLNEATSNEPACTNLPAS